MTVTFDVGPTLLVFGTAYEAVIPPSIPHVPNVDGFVADCGTQLRSWIAAQKNGTWIRAQENGVYHSETPITVPNKFGLLIDGEGATLKCTVTAPNMISFTDGIVTHGFDVDGLPRTFINSQSASFAKLKTTPYAWYVVGPGMPKGARVDKKGYIDDHNVMLVKSYQGQLGSGISIRITHPDDRNRSNFLFDRGGRMVLRNWTLQGAHPHGAAFDPTYEGQANVDWQGTVDFEVEHNLLTGAWGDGITLSRKTTLPSGYAHDNEISWTGRHGLSIGAADGFDFKYNDVHDIGRHHCDVEPNADLNTCQHIRLIDNDWARAHIPGWIAISAYAGVHVFVGDFWAVNNRVDGNSLNVNCGTNHSGSPRWDGFHFINNRSNLHFGTGINGQTNTDWTSVPAVLKFQYCDNVEVTGNHVFAESGRGMYAVWAQFSRFVSAHDNFLTEPGVPGVGIDAAHELHVVPFNAVSMQWLIGPYFGITGEDSTEDPVPALVSWDIGPRFGITASVVEHGTVTWAAGPTFGIEAVDSTGDVDSIVFAIGPTFGIEAVDSTAPPDVGMTPGPLSMQNTGWDHESGWDAGGWDA